MPKLLLKLGAFLCILAGVGLLAYSGYKVWDPFAGARQHAAQENLLHTWDVSNAKPATSAAASNAMPSNAATASCTETNTSLQPSEAFAIIRIPAFGPSWKFTIVQGTTLTQLATGPGHIIGTVLPGQAGNTGIAAHDITAGNPFLHLGSLQVGDKVIITTKHCVVTYQLTKAPYKVLYTDIGVLRPVGNEHTITLVTCWPVSLNFVTHRIVVPGIQVSSIAR